MAPAFASATTGNFANVYRFYFPRMALQQLTSYSQYCL